MNTKLPLVSIVLPTFNGANYIRESIDSCLAQTMSDLELIVVDDCSTDNTPEILACYDDSRMRVIQHPVNRKLPAALNTGFAYSRGKYLTWTSDDNRYAPDALDVMTRALENHNCIGLVYAGMRLIDATGTVIRLLPTEEPRCLMERCVVGACFLYRRLVYEVVGEYNESLFRIEDYDYWLRVAKHFTISPLPEILYDYRTHPNSLTREEDLVQRAKAFDHVHTLHFGADPRRFWKCLGELYASQAFESYLRGSSLKEVIGYVLLAARNDPKHLRNRGIWAIMVRSLLKQVRSVN